AAAPLAWGATLAVPLLTGSPERGFMAGPLLIPFAARFVPRPERTRASRPRLAATAAVALAFAASLSTAQWWPALELLRSSPRMSEMNTAARTFWSVHPLEMAQSFFPAFLDQLPLSWEFRSRVFDGREPYLRSVYLGIASLGLVMAGASGRRRRLWFFFLIVTAASALLALGRHSPAYGVAMAALPPLRTLRFPAKALVMAAFGWSVMAGLGFDAWRDGERGRPG